MGNGIGLSLYALGAMRVERRLRRVFSKSRWVKRCKFRFALALSLCVAVSSVPGRDFLRAPPSPARLEQDTLSTHQRDCIVNCTSKPRNSLVHVAVVIPFLQCQIERRLKPSIRYWERIPPCQSAPSIPTTLIFHYNKVLSANAKSDLEGFWITRSLDVKKCFTSVEIWSAGLSTQEDEYPLGTCVMFHRTFSYLRQYGVSHWLQYEPDVVPIRKGWLARALFLVEDNPTCGLWWQLGSEPSYDSVTDFLLTSTGTKDVDLHINGNALYCVNSSEFALYRLAVRQMSPPMGCFGDTHLGEFNGLDHALYRLRHSSPWKQSTERFHYKFRLDPFIRNFGSAAFDLQAVRTMYPDTYLIHGKYQTLSRTERIHARLSNRVHLSIEEENKISRLHWQAVGRLPTNSELHLWFKIFLINNEREGVLLKLINRLHHACDFKRPDWTLMQYFDSYSQLAVVSSFLKIRQVMPGPVDVAAVAKHVVIINQFQQYCKLAVKQACKKAKKPVISSTYDSYCLRDPPAHFLRLFDENWQFIGSDEKTLHVRRYGKIYKLKEAVSCREVKMVHGSLNCKSKLISSFISSTPHVRRRLPARDTKSSLFVDKIRVRYPSTNFHLVSNSGSDFIKSHIYFLESGALQRRGTVWTTDFHAGPFAGNQAIFSEINIKIDARIDFGNCVYFKDDSGGSVCANVKGLKVLANNDWNGFGLHPCPAQTRKDFYYAYVDDPEFQQVGAVMCSHPVANCELYMPFDKPIILYLTTRLEFGRNDRHVPWREPWMRRAGSSEAWKAWIDNFMKIAEKEHNVILANNEYDAKYVEYFTGIKPQIIPSWSGPSLTDLGRFDPYLPTKLDILLTPYRTNLEYHAEDIPTDGWPNMDAKPIMNVPLNHPIFDEIDTVEAHSNVEFNIVTMAEAYPRGYSRIEDLREYPLFLFIPYQASVMSFFELYRLGVPMLVPSQKLLLRWMKDHRLLFERVYGDPANILLPKMDLPSPNSFRVEDAKQWIQFYDIYQRQNFPHLLYFDSWSHAIQLTQTTDLASISAKMNQHNRAEFVRISALWQEVFDRTNMRNRNSHRQDPRNLDFESALWRQYRTTVRSDDHNMCKRHGSYKMFSGRSRSNEFLFSEGFSKCSEHQSKLKPPSAYQSNLFDVISGKYLQRCTDTHFDERANRLTCATKHGAAEVANPYACSTLKFTHSDQLLCF